MKNAIKASNYFSIQIDDWVKEKKQVTDTILFLMDEFEKTNGKLIYNKDDLKIEKELNLKLTWWWEDASVFMLVIKKGDYDFRAFDLDNKNDVSNLIYNLKQFNLLDDAKQIALYFLAKNIKGLTEKEKSIL